MKDVQLVPALWSERLEALLVKLDPEMTVEAVRRELEAQRFLAFEVNVDGLSVGFFIVRIDLAYGGWKELVHMFSLAEVQGKTPVHHVMGAIVSQLAAKLGCRRVRVHSQHRKIDAFLEREGFEFMESVFIKEII